MAWLATVWKIDIAKSGNGILRAIRFCTSVLANTPHREATGYIFVKFQASSFNLPIGTLIRSAIWSMKAPVPPAHEPFIRMSGCLPSAKKTILASSPPKSISVCVSG